MRIREYQISDLQEMIKIWNEVVEEGAAFPQEEKLNDVTGKDFFHHKAIAASQKKRELLLVCIFCIPIMWGAADIFVMQAMPSVRHAEESV